MPNHFDDMNRSLPKAYREDEWVTALLDAVSELDTAQRETAQETVRQMFLPSMTWALEIEERVADLQSPTGAGPEDRRAALAAKWRSATGKCDIALIKQVCGAWPGVSTEVVYDGLSAIHVAYRIAEGKRVDLAAIQAALREIVPAHLGFAVLEILQRDATARIWTAGGGTQRRPHAEGVAILPRGACAQVKTAATGALHKTYEVNEVRV